MSVRHTTIHLFHCSAMDKCKAGSLQVQRSPILPSCVSQFYACLRFSATRDTTSSTDNHCPSALQRFRLLNGTLYGYLRVRHQPTMCVSLPMNASCASVLPLTHDYAYRACDTSTTPSRITPARPKMLSIVLVSNVQYGYPITLQHYIYQNSDYVLIIHNAVLTIYSFWYV